jgi:MATE family multidrug resistance protein
VDRPPNPSLARQPRPCATVAGHTLFAHRREARGGTEPVVRTQVTSEAQAPDRRGEIRAVIAMSVPVVVTMMSRAFMDVVDYTMLTGLHQPEAQAAILPSQIIMWAFIILGMGMASMVNTFASQSLGRGDLPAAASYAWQAVHIAIAFGIAALALRFVLPTLIVLLGHEPAVQALELAYTRIALFTVGPTLASYGLGWFFIGVHRPWPTMWSAIEANVVNVAVNYVLIFGHLGVEPMGIAGAAWGTMAAVSYRSLRLGLLLVAPSINELFQSRRMWRPSRRRLADLCRVGLPFSIQMFCEVLVWAVFVSLLIGRTFGTLHLIATNTAWQYMRIAFMPAMGLGQAVQALVGKSIGAGRQDRAIREVRIAAVLVLAYMFVLSLIYAAKADALIALFNDRPEVVAIGAKVMLCTAVFLLFDAISVTYASALRGAGDTFVPSVFFAVSHWVVIVGGGWLVARTFPQLGSVGPWMAASVLIIVTAVFLWWRWHGRAWMKLDLFKADNLGRDREHV